MATLVKALRGHRYGGKFKSKGDTYEIADGSHLRLFKALGWVSEHVEPEVVSAPALNYYGSYYTRSLEAEDAPKPKRTYTRRKKVEE